VNGPALRPVRPPAGLTLAAPRRYVRHSRRARCRAGRARHRPQEGHVNRPLPEAARWGGDELLDHRRQRAAGRLPAARGAPPSRPSPPGAALAAGNDLASRFARWTWPTPPPRPTLRY